MKKSFKFIAALFTLMLTIFISNAVDATAGVETAAAVGGLLEGPSKVRSIYKSLKNLELGGASIMEHFIRQEVVLKNTKGTYEFDFRSTGIGAYNNEPQIELLDRNDVFVATHMFIGLYQADSASVGQVKGPLQTCVVPGAGDYWTVAAGFDPADLHQLYQGKIIYKSSNKEELEGMNMRAHYFAHEKQGDLATDIVQGVNPEDGMQDFSVFPFIQGDSDTLFKIEAPIFDGINWEQLGTLQSRVVMELHGVIVKNVSKDNKTLETILRSAAQWQ